MKLHFYKILLLVFLFSNYDDLIAQTVYVDKVSSNFAGVYGSYSLTDGTGTAARFYDVQGICIDGSGNIFVADRLNHAIRKVTPAGVVTTIAGNGTAGYVDATGSAARFDQPYGICVDASGNLYVTEENNYCIRKITPGGVVTTLAGSTTCGFVDATGSAARFCDVKGICIDPSGNLYVADRLNYCIRKVTQAGVVTTFAGSGTNSGYVDATGSAARFNKPEGVCSDASGNIYVLDNSNYRVRKITPGAVVTTIAGNGTAAYADGPALSASFDYMYGIGVDATGNVYVGGSARIRKITKDGYVVNYCGNGTGGNTNGPLSVTQVISTRGIVFNSAGDAYVASTYLRKFSTQPSLTGFNTNSGTASSSQSFSVSGTSLSSNLVVTAPTNFEVALSSSGPYSSSVSISPSGNVVTSTTIYIRIKSSATSGSKSGSISVSSTSATTVNLSVSGTVNSTTAVLPQLNDAAFSYYPNPTVDVVYISVKDDQINTLQLYSVTGNKVLEYEVNKEEYILNMESLDKGIYYLHIHTRKGEKIEKIVKQ